MMRRTFVQGWRTSPDFIEPNLCVQFNWILLWLYSFEVCSAIALIIEILKWFLQTFQNKLDLSNELGAFLDKWERIGRIEGERNESTHSHLYAIALILFNRTHICRSIETEVMNLLFFYQVHHTYTITWRKKIQIIFNS